MELRIFTEPQQGASYDDLLRVARTAEDAGYGAFFRSDHYLKMGSVDGLPGPTDPWITFAGLARDTTTIRLGTLMTAATFRYPGPLAISVAQVDQMSGGRVEFGIGAGWYEAEHTAYGIPFPTLGARFERYEEQLAIITGLWETPVGGTFSFEGKHYTLTDSPALPKPAQERVPVLIGGMGARRTPALAATYATEFNLPFVGLDAAVEQYARVDAACAEMGRDPREITRSVALVACVGRTDADVARRAAVIGREVDELKQNGLCGSPAEIVDRIGAWRDATGVQRVYLQILDLADLDHITEIASDVAPQF
ncbi:LLM class F420-dependent oxidoreductase [Lentzea aerocolonigenes]|uniref:LLM class F420-dependent oxidoreductase n=1 Tax=Lentzea aerocolonigenes TaxID=68170 RepID=UPI0004C3DA86|nr:LLM class F420-dependent oxidoreductase [Lentzea aerocolonigenes]MCP2242954.1 putative F420-dependent oxidoreductase, Rv1855c family [Lentzea aerocolonigenes]